MARWSSKLTSKVSAPSVVARVSNTFTTRISIPLRLRSENGKAQARAKEMRAACARSDDQ
jgi:hypothetical protein